jgi:3',5'-cyclic-AMP phosphodiesterase
MVKLSTFRPLLMAQISDLHLFADPTQSLLGWNTWMSIEAILKDLMACRPLPEVLLLTGDLAQDESTAAYHNVVKLFTPLGIPTYWLPGNHDDVPTMNHLLSQPPFCRDKSFEMGGWRIILLNSNVPGKVHGRLQPAELDWFEAELANTPVDQPTVVALHHPPFTVNSPWLDKNGLLNADEFLAIVDRHPQIRLVLFGHIHQESRQVRNGVTYLSAPSTCIQFLPKSFNFALDDTQPGFRLLWLYPDGHVETAVQRVYLSQQLDFAAQGY